MVDELGRKVRNALIEARKVCILRRTSAAEERWCELYGKMAEDDTGGWLGSAIARDAAQTLRLSVTYALLDGSHHIDLAHLEAAWALWCYCRASAGHIFGQRLGDEVGDPLLDALRRAGPNGSTRPSRTGLSEAT